MVLIVDPTCLAACWRRMRSCFRFATSMLPPRLTVMTAATILNICYGETTPMQLGLYVVFNSESCSARCRQLHLTGSYCCNHTYRDCSHVCQSWCTSLFHLISPFFGEIISFSIPTVACLLGFLPTNLLVFSFCSVYTSTACPDQASSGPTNTAFEITSTWNWKLLLFNNFLFPLSFRVLWRGFLFGLPAWQEATTCWSAGPALVPD